MALYNNPYQYSFGVPGQMNQFQQQPVQIPTQAVQQPQQNNNGILWVSGEVGAKYYQDLTEAVNNANKSTVKLLKDITITDRLNIINKEVVLDLNKPPESEVYI